MNQEQRLWALRGATRCQNEEADMGEQVAALYDELLARNGLEEADIVSLIFSLTGDLDVKNPAACLRQSGRALNLALFVTQEAFVQGGLDRTIRVLVHAYLKEDRRPMHIYLNGAEALRPDFAGNTGERHG
jgi:chorismate mutase